MTTDAEYVAKQALKAGQAINDDDREHLTDPVCGLLHLAQEAGEDPIAVAAGGIEFWAMEDAGVQEEIHDTAARLTGAPIANPGALNALDVMQTAMHAMQPSLADVIRQWLNEAKAKAEAVARANGGATEAQA